MHLLRPLVQFDAAVFSCPFQHSGLLSLSLSNFDELCALENPLCHFHTSSYPHASVRSVVMTVRPANRHHNRSFVCVP